MFKTVLLLAALAASAGALAASDGVDGLTGLALAAGYGAIAGLLSALVVETFEWPPFD